MHPPPSHTNTPALPLDFIRLLYGIAAQAQTMIDAERTRWDTLLMTLKKSVAGMSELPTEAEDAGRDRGTQDLTRIIEQMAALPPGTDALLELQRKITLIADTYKLLLIDKTGNSQRLYSAVYAAHQGGDEAPQTSTPVTLLHC